MRKYWEIMKSQIQLETAYTVWFWAGTFSTIIKLFILYYFWHAVYEHQTTIAGMSYKSILTYMVIALFLEQYVADVGQQLALYTGWKYCDRIITPIRLSAETDGFRFW